MKIDEFEMFKQKCSKNMMYSEKMVRLIESDIDLLNYAKKLADPRADRYLLEKIYRIREEIYTIHKIMTECYTISRHFYNKMTEVVIQMEKILSDRKEDR